MLARIAYWINDRWPLLALLRLGREEEIPGGASFSYTLGSAAVAIFLLQVITGIWQIMYYVPTVDHAYDSLNYFRTQVPFGWLIHGIHYWGANALILIVVIHLGRVFIWGAYKTPRELTWLTGVVLLVFAMGLSFSGAPLPWDERGYWAVEVGTNMAGTVPVIGGFIKRLLRGGDVVGQLTLSRFFILHAAVLPALVVAIIGVHILAFRRFGSVGPWQEKQRALKGPFWPDQVFRDAVVGTVLLLLLIALSVFAPPPISGPADPVDTSFVPKPEWNFLFLYEALKFFPGRIEALGTVGIPTLAVLLLALVPFFDRRPERRPAKRPLALGLGLIAAAGVVTLTMIGIAGRPTAGPPSARELEKSAAVAVSASARAGSRAFSSLGCIGCHRVNGVGGSVGPDLSHEALAGRTRRWLIAQIQNPKVHDPQSIMPSFTFLNKEQANNLVDYLLSLAPLATPPSRSAATAKPGAGTVPTSQPASASPPTALGPPGRAAGIIGSSDHGGVLFHQHCASCHGPQGADGVPNPGSGIGKVPALQPAARQLFSQEPQIFAENIDRFIQHGAVAQGGKAQFRMPAFGATNALTQQEIADIEAYILHLNGIDRARLAHPGLPPRRFLLLVVALFGISGTGLGGAWIWIHRRMSLNKER